MNYFGFFFSFMLPGIALGALFTAAIFEEISKRKRRAAKKRCVLTPVHTKTKLYVLDLQTEAA